LKVLTGLDVTLLLLGLVFFIAFALIAWVSAYEKQKRAKNISLILGSFLLIMFTLIPLLDKTPDAMLSWLLLAFTILIILAFTAPINKKLIAIPDTPSKRYDERDIPFSRVKLKEGDEHYIEYYRNNPEKKAVDDRWRQQPKLLSPETPTFHPFYSVEGDACFDEIDLLYDQVDGDVNPVKQDLDIDEITKEIHKYAKRLKAKNVAICRLKDYHLYSVKGRGENYGRSIQKKHHFAIVLTVEMDSLLNRTAPQAPSAYESARRYVKSAHIAIELASYIRKLGYSARAHIDTNYEVICALCGRDAGLGEIGRMSILMSPQLGPRFRMAVVTTSLALKPNKRNREPAMIDFCCYCKKCATNCPVKAIPAGEMKNHDGLLQWKINHDKCFSYWKKTGTDCGKCMAVCPYSHPDNSFHRLVKWLIKRNILFRRLAVHLDDLFYGKHPRVYPVEKLENHTSLSAKGK
jgi:reductive dehalogenase